MGGAKAQEMVERVKKPLPGIEAVAPESFEAQTKLYEVSPGDDEFLNYSLRLPKDWTLFKELSNDQYSISNRLLGEVARYYSPPSMHERSYFSVRAHALDHQMTAEQWFFQYLFAQGYTLEGVNVQGNNRLEALYVLLEKDVSYIVRAVVQVNGKRVVFAQYYLPTSNWDAEKAMQASVVQSFALTNPDTGLVEDMDEYAFLDVAKIKYPVSWKLSADTLRSVDHMTAELLNISKKDTRYYYQKQLQGRVQVNLVSNFVAGSLEEEIEKYKTSVLDDGFSLSEAIDEPEDFTFSDEIEFADVKVYDALDSNNSVLDYELWMTVMAANNYYYFLTLLTPSRDADYEMWSRNTAAFKIINRFVEPSVDEANLRYQDE
jgi:hypothetical protein